MMYFASDGGVSDVTGVVGQPSVARLLVTAPASLSVLAMIGKARPVEPVYGLTVATLAPR